MSERVFDEKIFYAVALTFAPKIGSITARKLLAHFEQPQNIFRESARNLTKLGFLNPASIKSLLNGEVFKLAENEIEFAIKYSIDILFINDEVYPYRLRHCPDAPLILYKKGNASLNPLKSVSVVGTRKATIYGRQQTEKIIASMQGDNIQIVSGLASGIDTYAHKSALDAHLETIAVLGTGLNIIYPAENKSLAKKISQFGALITEFSFQLKPEKENFPRRNRIIAGMSDAIIVIETGKRGGALITAELGISYSRDVFALPGRCDDVYSEGCNWLIKTNKAGLITSAEDLYYNMNWNLPGHQAKNQQTSLTLSEDDEKIVRLLQTDGACSIDYLCNATGFTLSKTATLLLQLEMAGIVRSLPGKMYHLC